MPTYGDSAGVGSAGSGPVRHHVFFKDIQSYMQNTMGELSRLRKVMEDNDTKRQQWTDRLSKELQSERYETRELTNKFRYEMDELVHTRVTTVIEGLEDMEQSQKNKDRIQQQQLDTLEKDMSNLRANLIGVNGAWCKMKQHSVERSALGSVELPSEQLKKAQQSRKSVQLFQSPSDIKGGKNDTTTSLRARVTIIGDRNDLEKLYSVVDMMRLRMQNAACSIAGTDIEKLFRLFDEDGSGQVNELEFRHMVRGKLRLHDESDEEISQIFSSIDGDSSGFVDVEELIDFVLDPAARTRHRLKHAIEEMGDNWGKLLKDVDTDGSGQIDFPEFQKMCRTQLKLLDSDVHLLSVFRALDSDHSQEISLEELASWVGSAPAPRSPTNSRSPKNYKGR